MRTTLVLLACFALFFILSGSANAQNALSCTSVKKSKRFLLLLDTQSTKHTLTLIHRNNKSNPLWRSSTSSVQGYQIVHQVIRFKVPGAKGKGILYRIFLNGQKSQMHGAKYFGKILLYTLRYPIPANVRMAPTLSLCTHISFPSQTIPKRKVRAKIKGPVPPANSPLKLTKQLWQMIARAELKNMERFYASQVVLVRGSELLKPRWGIAKDRSKSTPMSRATLMKGYHTLFNKAGKRWIRIFTKLKPTYHILNPQKNPKVTKWLGKLPPHSVIVGVKLRDSFIFVWRLQTNGFWKVIMEYSDY